MRITISFIKKLMPRSFMKTFYSKATNEEKINFTDERINQLIRKYMDTDNLDKRKRYQNEIKDTMNFRSKFTDVQFKDSLVHSIVNGGPISRIGINDRKFYGEVVLPNNTITEETKYLEHLKKYVQEINKLSYEKQKEKADNKENFFHILGCCLLCCKDLICNKDIKIGEEAHIYCCIEGNIIHNWFIQDENAHIKIACKRISDKIYNSFIPICDGSFIESEIQL